MSTSTAARDMRLLLVADGEPVGPRDATAARSPAIGRTPHLAPRASRRGRLRGRRGGGYAGPDPMAAPDALQQPVELDLFEGPFDLLLAVLRDEVDLLKLLVEVVTAALGERARERWDVETAGELIVLLAAMTELKARRLLGEPVDEEPDLDALEARERLASRLVAYAPFPRAAAWLAGAVGTPPARAIGASR